MKISKVGFELLLAEKELSITKLAELSGISSVPLFEKHISG